MINLTLHGIGKPCRPLDIGEDRYWLTEETLETILDALLKVDDFTLTLDDANQSDVSIVLPALQARKLTAVFFIPAGKLGQQGYLTQKDIQTLIDSGMEIGSHGIDHRDWRTLKDSDLLAELSDSKKILEEITGKEVQKAACPFGSYDRRVLRYLQKTNFHKVYTSDRGRAKSQWWIQPRNSLVATDNHRTLESILTQPHSLRDILIMSAKRFVKRQR